MTSTLASQPLSLGSGVNPQPGDVVAHLQPQATVVQPEQNMKRRPGRPKGSGKKAIDLGTEPKVKRPVGRPRKDGLPAGSVGPKKPGRPRKRAPGTYATPTNMPSPSLSYPPPPFVDPAQWASISAGPMASLSVRAPPNMNFPLDPTLDRDNWAELARIRPDAFLHALVTALSAPNPVSAAGPSVEDAFRAHLASLTPNVKNNNMPSIPALYSILKTFWLPSSPAYFALTASASTQRSTPSEYRFLYWDPQPLVFNGIACPFCGTPLVNKGRITSGPIKIYDLGKPFFIIGCEYVCRSPQCLSSGTQGEGRRFASTDNSILRALPPKLKDEFPARLIQGPGPTADMGPGTDVWSWRGMGVSTGLWDMVRASLRAGLHKDVIMGIIHAVIQGLPDDPWVLPPPADVEEKRDGMVEGDNADLFNDSEGQRPANEGEEQNVEGSSNKERPEAEEFQEAWATHNGQPEAGGSAMPEAGPSDPSMNQQVAVPPPPPAEYNPYGPPPPNPYAMPFGYPPYGYYPPPTGHPPPPPPPSTLKRTFALVDSDGTEPTPRRVRHCVKCGSNECKGKGGRTFCMNPCQDCGKLDCRGRNSKRPDRTCADAWSPSETTAS